MTDRTDALKTLHTSLIDSRNGYDEAVKQAAGEGLTPLFQDMIALRTNAANELATHLLSLGEKADADGSFMSTVHRTVIDLRSYITGLDANVLPALISGEERIVGYYDAALEASAPADPEYAVLIDQRDALKVKIRDMEVMHARAAA